MLLPLRLAPSRASGMKRSPFTAPSPSVLNLLRIANGVLSSSPIISILRHASHQAQGRANGAKDGPGKRLGAKKHGGEYVIPGNIIFRQRGTSWFPGENCAFGRDHCVYATESGYVRYYRDPRVHPKRQYIGVALGKEDRLPYPPHVVRRRRLGMYAVRVPQEVAKDGEGEGAGVVGRGGADGSMRDAVVPGKAKTVVPTMGKGYSLREANWSIGRVAETARVQVKLFEPGDRWAAWRKRAARIKKNEERRRLKNAGKKVAKPKKARQPRVVA